MLKVYNTLTKNKVEFKPFDDNVVTMYVCGPTVYDYSHLGHAKTYIHFDLIARYLRCAGYKVKYVQNITDVGHLEHDLDEGDDKIVKRAKKEHVEPMELVEIYTREYFRDMDSLNVIRPNISPRASAHIPEIIELVKDLLRKGFAYEVNGSVYFDTEKFSVYGSLSGRKLEDAKAGFRIEIKAEKKHFNDFALWKKADKAHILQWPSPWGWGYPGWHIECSVMGMKYLGNTIDIHGGAVELVFPHHENEVAQSEAFSGQQFVRYWLHGGVVMVDGQKMSKSLGNFITIKDILKRFSPEVVRFFIVSRHYRQPIDFKEALIQESEKIFSRIQETIQKLISRAPQEDNQRKLGPSLNDLREKYRSQFKQAMDDDFNTPVAIATILEMTKEINKMLSLGGVTQNNADELLAQYEEFGMVLGVFEKISRVSTLDASSFSYIPTEIAIMVGERERARQDKQWQKSDEIRNILSQRGWLVEDAKNGTKLKKLSEGGGK